MTGLSYAMMNVDKVPKRMMDVGVLGLGKRRLPQDEWRTIEKTCEGKK